MHQICNKVYRVYIVFIQVKPPVWKLSKSVGPWHLLPKYVHGIYTVRKKKKMNHLAFHQQESPNFGSLETRINKETGNQRIYSVMYPNLGLLIGYIVSSQMGHKNVSPVLGTLTFIQNDRWTHPLHISHWPQLTMIINGLLLKSRLDCLQMMHFS